MSSSPPSSAPGTLEATLSWRGDRIAFQCLDRRGEVTLGDHPGSFARLPPASIGAERFVVARRSASATLARIPAGRRGTLTRDGGARERIEGPAEVALACGDALDLGLDDFSIHLVASTREPVAALRRTRFGAAIVGPIVAAAFAHALVLGLAAQAAQAREADDGDEPAADLRALLISAEQRDLAHVAEHDDGPGGKKGADVDQHAGDGRAGGGDQAAGSEGTMGAPASRAGQSARFAVPKRFEHEPDRYASREAALAEAGSFGMIGLVLRDRPDPARMAEWDWAAASAGSDALAAQGALRGAWQGSTSGYEGLGLTGIGEGGGGKGEGIGLGTIGTLGHGQGTPGDGTGGGGSPTSTLTSWWGDRGSEVRPGLGSVGRGQRVSASARRKAWPRWGGGYGGMVSGRLPPESIYRILHHNQGRFRICYENGLRRNPTLEGRVVIRFIIGRDGSVSSVEDGGSTLPDPAVVSCVLRAAYGLSFPAPEGGIVTVTYPIVLSPA